MYVSIVSTSYTEQNWKFFEQLYKMYVGGALRAPKNWAVSNQDAGMQCIFTPKNDVL